MFLALVCLEVGQMMDDLSAVFLVINAHSLSECYIMTDRLSHIHTHTFVICSRWNALEALTLTPVKVERSTSLDRRKG